ncbi:hypothetical protein ES702_06916 [subsurface metagenome]
MARTHEDWVILADRRIRNILKDRRLCSQSQLEAKISEAGPPDSRPDPQVIREARRNLLKEAEIKEIRIRGVTPLLYALPSFDIGRERERYERIRKAYQIYQRTSREQELCGDVAESIIYRAIILGDSMHIAGGVKEDLRYFNGKKILDEKPLDSILTHKGTGIALGVEVKNKRKWYHRKDSEMWAALAKCASIGVLPVFVARKLDYLLYPLFSAIGCFGYRLHNQYFHPSVEKELSDVRHKDGLGFADIRFPKKTKGGFSIEPRHIRYFKKTIPEYIENYSERYNEVLPALVEYLVERRFWEEPWDEELFTEFMVEIGVRQPFDEYEGP